MVTLLPESPPLCPRCGRRMAIIEVAVPTPPFVVQLVGCEICGITSNEQPAEETTPAGAARSD